MNKLLLRRSILIFSNNFRYSSQTVPFSIPILDVSFSSDNDTAAASYPTKVTTLKNGLKVASEDGFGSLCTLGVVIDSGCRYESAFPSGICHFLEKLAFSKTENFSSRNEVSRILELHGGMFDCQRARDVTCYAMSANRSNGVKELVKVIADVIMRPVFDESEMENAKNAIRNEITTLAMMPDQEPFMHEMIHTAAYRANTLGLSKTCPSTSLNLITPEVLKSYISKYYVPQRMVLVGVGVDHEEFVSMAEEYFGSYVGSSQVEESVAQYTGGLEKEAIDLSNVSLGPTEMPDLVHVALGAESCNYFEEGFFAYAVMNMLLGGGGSFSAGGPGKGMYSRLYTQVLNQYHWVHNCVAFHQAYNDTGLFYIYASSSPERLREMIAVIQKQFIQLLDPIPKEELDRAKRQLESFLLMNLESRPVIFEDIGRQVLAFGHRKDIKHNLERIEAVDSKAIEKAAAHLLNSNVSVAVKGNLKNLPQYSDIQKAFVDGSLKKSLKASNNLLNWFK